MVRACKPCDGSYNKCRLCQGSEPNGWWNSNQAIRGADLTGRTYMITGANTGIGFVTARTLLAAGAKVIITTRSPEKTNDTINRLIEGLPLTKSPNAKGLSMDLSSFDSIKEAVQEFTKLNLRRLDAVCLNAGVMGISEFTETRESLEMHWGVNHVGHFYLLKLLMPTILKVPGHTKIVIVSSMAHTYTPNNFTVNTHLPPKREDYDRSVAYSISKLCNILTAREIARRFSGRGVSAYSVHPGFISGTSLYRAFPGCVPCILNCCAYAHCCCLWYADYKPVDKGASTQLFVMTEPVRNLENGGYYSNCRLQTRKSPCYKYRIIENEEEAQNLWELTESIIANETISI